MVRPTRKNQPAAAAANNFHESDSANSTFPSAIRESKTPERVSSADQVVSEILRGMYDGLYVPGQKLTESDLTKKYGVSRGSVREALKRLAAEGIVTINLHFGARVRMLTRTDVRDVLEVLEVLVGLAAKLATGRDGASADRQALRATLRTLSDAQRSGNGYEFARERNRFYRQLARLGGNQELARHISGIQAHLVRIQFRNYNIAAEKHLLGDYQGIIAAVLAGDAKKAESATRRHIRRVATGIQRLPDRAFA